MDNNNTINNLEVATMQLRGMLSMAEAILIQVGQAPATNTMTAKATSTKQTKQKETVDKPVTTTKTVTLKDIIDATKSAVEQHKADQVKLLFTSFGIKKCQDCPEENRAELLQKLCAL